MSRACLDEVTYEFGVHGGTISFRLHKHVESHGEEPHLFKKLGSFDEDGMIILCGVNQNLNCLRQEAHARADNGYSSGGGHEKP